MRFMHKDNTQPDTHSYPRTAANHRPLTPLDFLSWAATVYPDWTATIYGEHTQSYAEFYERCSRLAGALEVHGIRPGDVVSIIAPNIPAMLEAQFGVPMAGAILNPISLYGDISSIAYILDHSEAKMVLVDQSVAETVAEAVHLLAHPPIVVEIRDDSLPNSRPICKLTYEKLMEDGCANYEWPGPEDEWDSIALCYTRGTEGMPKGVLLHHRGAFLDATADVISNGMSHHPVYLWSLPMFRAYGWCYSYAVTAVAGTHILTRDNADGDAVMEAIRAHKVTHLSGKPGFLNLLADATDNTPLPHTVHLDVVESNQDAAILKKLEAMGFDVSFVYGMTESYGPAAICSWKAEGSAIASSEKDGEMKQVMLAHPSAHYPTLERLIVADPDTEDELPADGRTVGEVMMRGNTLFKGYLKDPDATREALEGGWFHTGDLGVLHPDGHLEIRQRKQDALMHDATHEISFVTVAEEILNAHPDVVETVITAIPRTLEHKPGRPKKVELVAFVVPGPNISVSNKVEILDFCRQKLPKPLQPERIEFVDELPKNEDGEVLRYQLRELEIA